MLLYRIIRKAPGYRMLDFEMDTFSDALARSRRGDDTVWVDEMGNEFYNSPAKAKAGMIRQLKETLRLYQTAIRTTADAITQIGNMDLPQAEPLDFEELI